MKFDARSLMAVPLLLSLVSCGSSTSLVGRWSDPAYQGKSGQKVLVVAMAESERNARVWEDSFGKALTASSLVFVSKAALRSGLRRKLGVDKEFVAVEHTRDISKKSMIHNGATPDITVDPETYEVTADGELLTCAPADVLPMAQRYFLF